MPESLPGSCGRSVVLFPGMVSRNMLQPVRWLRWWGVVHFVETISVWWRAAAQMERSVGQSVSDTINQFKRLKDDPVNAAKALDNELHFLTATQLEQIRVLGDQGRSSDAARIAMSALAEETGRRTADIDNNLNALGSTLKYLSDLWSRFWDAAMNIGREDSLDEQIAALQESVAGERLPGRHHLLRLNTISSVLTIFRRKNARRICRMQKSRQSGIIRSNRNDVMLKMLH